MHPKLFTIGPFTIYSFGLMMALGFIAASAVFSREVLRKNLSADFSSEMIRFLRIAVAFFTIVFVGTFSAEFGFQRFFTELGSGSYLHSCIVIAAIVIFILLPKLFTDKNSADTSTLVVMMSLIGGLSGSKILYVIENWTEFSQKPFSTLFDPGGLTWYGGFLLTTGLIFIFTKSKGIPFAKLCDAAAPALIIGYGVARIGCHLAGDGDYGMPTNLPWASVYSAGTYPPSVAFRDFPEIVKKYGINGVVPDTIPVHPAPLYEFFAALFVFFILWMMRKKMTVDGALFSLYLILAGIERFSIEFIRLNPRILFGLTEAQLIAAVSVIVGFIGLSTLSKRKPEPAAVS